MLATGLWNARIGYCDREGSIAYMLLCFGADVDVKALLDWLGSDSRFQLVTDAQRCAVYVEKLEYIDSPSATVSGMHVGTLVFSTNDPNDFGVLDVPGMPQSMALQTTCFVGRAIDMQNEAITTLAAMAIADPPLVTPSGNRFTSLIAAGFRHVWQELERSSG